MKFKYIDDWTMLEGLTDDEFQDFRNYVYDQTGNEAYIDGGKKMPEELFNDLYDGWLDKEEVKKDAIRARIGDGQKMLDELEVADEGSYDVFRDNKYDKELLDSAQVNEFEDHLRKAESEIEAAARLVCSSHNPAAIEAYRSCQRALEYVAESIHKTHLFRKWD